MLLEALRKPTAPHDTLHVSAGLGPDRPAVVAMVALMGVVTPHHRLDWHLRLSKIASKMKCLDLLPPDLQALYDFREWRNPCAVLSVGYPEEWADILEILRDFRLLRSDIGEAGIKGGGKSLVAIRMDRLFRDRGWEPKEFDTKIVVNNIPIESPTHEVDCFKGKVALELEWNNKTEFYDRDLNNFRLLFELRVADVGIIITRCDELQTIFNNLGRGSSYGSTTTIFSKLVRKLDGGAGGGCPVLAIGMRKALYVDDITNPALGEKFKRIERTTRRRRRP